MLQAKLAGFPVTKQTMGKETERCWAPAEVLVARRGACL